MGVGYTLGPALGNVGRPLVPGKVSAVTAVECYAGTLV